MDAKSASKSATLTVGNKTYDFPILSGTVGPDVIDIAKLYAQSGMFTYDPGFTSTGSCQSKITYIDGDAGIHLEACAPDCPIEQLAEHGDFLETCYLLMYGELPSPQQKKDFDHLVMHHTMVHEQMARFFQGFRRDTPIRWRSWSRPLVRSPRSTTTPSTSTIRSSAWIASMRMIAKVPTLGGDGLQIYGRPALHVSEELALLCARTSCTCASRCRAEEYKINPVLADALDKILILHADHEQNASTSTVRIRAPALRAPIRSPASQPASRSACGAPRMAAPTKPHAQHALRHPARSARSRTSSRR